MGNTRFFCGPVDIHLEDLNIGKYRKALISSVNVFRIFKETNESVQAFLRMRKYTVKVESISFQGSLLREVGPEGSFFHYQFSNLTLEQKKYLHARLQSHGFDSPWKRKYARIPVNGYENSSEVPLGISFSRFAGKSGGIVKNFSVHGMYVELNSITPSMEDRVGSEFIFKMVTTKGNLIDGFRGQIIRVYDQVLVPRKIRRGLGIRILDINDTLKLRYYQMIQGVCMKMKENHREEPLL